MSYLWPVDVWVIDADGVHFVFDTEALALAFYVFGRHRGGKR